MKVGAPKSPNVCLFFLKTGIYRRGPWPWSRRPKPQSCVPKDPHPNSVARLTASERSSKTALKGIKTVSSVATNSTNYGWKPPIKSAWPMLIAMKATTPLSIRMRKALAAYNGRRRITAAILLAKHQCNRTLNQANPAKVSSNALRK